MASSRCRRQRWRVSVWAMLMAATVRIGAQTQVPSPLDLRGAVALALGRHPSVKESQARVTAADEGRSVARLAYLPRLDLLWQENRATRTNVFGMLLPQSVVPAISGPVLDGVSPSSVWGSAGAALLTWEPVDFGQRGAGVTLASAEIGVATARRELTQLEIAATAADAFLASLAADQRVLAARANVERVEVFRRSVSTLVGHQLRPGVDAARADAEVAAATIQLIHAEQAAQLARIALAEAAGIDGPIPQLNVGRLLEPLSWTPVEASGVEQHPSARTQRAAVDVVRARENVASKSYLPRISFQSAIAARGSGADVSGLDRDGNGLLPQVSNWAAGLSITFPVVDLFSSRTRLRLEFANEQVEQARYEQTLQGLRAQEARAGALVRAAEQIAANTPIQLRAAQEAERQARGRYDAGLGTVTDVADAQRVLAQAEVDEAVGRLSIWRARLAMARSRGDLTDFLNRVVP